MLIWQIWKHSLTASSRRAMANFPMHTAAGGSPATGGWGRSPMLDLRGFVAATALAGRRGLQRAGPCCGWKGRRATSRAVAGYSQLLLPASVASLTPLATGARATAAYRGTCLPDLANPLPAGSRQQSGYRVASPGGLLAASLVVWRLVRFWCSFRWLWSPSEPPLWVLRVSCFCG